MPSSRERRSSEQESCSVVQPGRLLIATAYHLLHRGPAQPQHIRVQLRAKPDKLLDAMLLRHEEALDLAVLSVDALTKQGIDVCALLFDRLGQMATLKRGNGVFAVGNPNGVSWALPVVADKVSQLTGNQIVFQSAFISSGHSRGALLDEQAHIVGMTTADQPPFGRAVNVDTILGVVKRWGYPAQLSLTLFDERGRTSLHLRVLSGNLTAIKSLLANCGDPNATDVEKLTPMHYAAMSGKVEIMSLLLQAGANLDAQDIGKDTPLHYAASNNQLESVRFLLKFGAKTNNKNSYDGATPLHWAVEKEQIEIIKLLLAAGADANAKTSNNTTLLTTALELGNKAVVELLQAQGAKNNNRSISSTVQTGHVVTVRTIRHCHSSIRP